jgi:Na+/H+ antiporter NhaD/arsenite permease-like protein
MFHAEAGAAVQVIFLLSYLVFAIGRLPGTRIDRPAMAVIGAALMFAFGALTPQQAIQSIDFATLVLLFSMMLIVASLHLSGFFDWITTLAASRLDAHHLLPAVVFSSGILSAFLVNDVVCLVMAPLVLRVARKMGRNPAPFLIALATASNIGSVASITGNPQNILIGSLSGIGYREFLSRLGPVAIAGLFLDWIILGWLLRKQIAAVLPAVRVDEEPRPSPRRLAIPVVMTVGVLAGFLLGYPPALVAAVGGALLLIRRSEEPKKIYEDVDWSLLLFFVGLFVIAGAAGEAGITGRLMSAAAGFNLNRPVVLAGVATLLSNVVSNVPAVILLKGIVPHFPNPHEGWLLLAMSSTLAGNLTITGSVANIIVVEKAREDAPIRFMDYARAGVPVTLATLAAGLLWLRYV